MTDRSLVDKVAEAICRAEHPGQDDEIYEVLVHDVPKYVLFAQAAIDAMQLHEETNGWPGKPEWGLPTHKRWVSPWQEKVGDD